jgi:glycolate dehydrogenase FAD-binding subunit
MEEVLQRLSETIREAKIAGRPLRICGRGTKDFYGHAPSGAPLDVTPYAGVVTYEPTELVITARAGTPLAEVEALLAAQGQMLAFEPPHFGAGATWGGCIAAGLSGPRRPYGGAARDVVLGVRMLDGVGRDLKFGGQVMKNVAGFDVSRLMVGALGTLGAILEASAKTLPAPAHEATLRLRLSEASAIGAMNRWATQPLPISATAFCDGELSVRLSGALPGVRAAHTKLGGDLLDEAEAKTFWTAIREHTHAFFAGEEPLWRLSLPSTTPPLALSGRTLMEWSGALRWLKSDMDAQRIRDTVARAGGHATLFRHGDKSAGVFHPLSPVLLKLHQRLKRTFDPAGILNPGRMYPEL